MPTEQAGSVQAFERTWTEPGGWIGALRTINNVPIARRYMVTAFVFFLIGGVQALLMRIQLGTPENTFLDAATYNQLFTMHGTTMMFIFVIPFIEALAAYMLPLQLGTRDLPFPRLTALSYWTYLFGGIFLYSSFAFGVAPDGGWFAYVPLTDKEFSPGINMDFWDLGLAVAEISALGAATELIVGIMRMRAPGMTFDRLPLFAWALLITAFMMILAFTPLIVATAMLELDRKGLTQFFSVEHGGDPLLWQHLFWLFGHPDVYIMFLPAAGIVSHIVQTFSGRPIVGYRLMVGAMVGTGAISFVLWVHHMFSTGMSPGTMIAVTGASMLITIPTGVQVFGWIATIWSGRPVWRTPMLFVGGFLVIFALGGITGVMVSALPFDWQAHDSYFVVAHFHYVLIGGVVFPLLAGLYYWLPKITGRRLSERIGKWNFWVMFIFFNITFFPMHLLGLLGMPRRVYTYQAGLGWDTMNLMATMGAFGFAIGVLLFVANVIWALKRGAEAGDNPWSADGLEWSERSPPAQAQFPLVPVVRGRHPLWEQQSLRPEDGDIARTLAALDRRPATWRGGVTVSQRGAVPVAMVHLPGPTIWPFVLSVALVFLLAGALLDSLLIAGVGALGAAAGLLGWFWPTESMRIAVEETRASGGSGGLPLGIHGPSSNGWWGTLVAVLILLVTLATLVVSYFSLASQWAVWEPPDTTESVVAVVAVFLAIGAGAATAWGSRGGAGAGGVEEQRKDEGDLMRRRLGLTAGLVLGLLVLAAVGLLAAYQEIIGVRPQDAHGSIILIMLMFLALVTLLHIVMLCTSQAWAWLAPEDARGLAPAKNAALVGYFLSFSFAVVVATLYLSPQLR